ncbi:CNNM domain-containing protein [Haloquadratum walsbyi]|jgi:Hemolysins and related proteins containing CBS domains|uniref:Hemolysin related proteins containing CBS domain protein n=1 Tax=Haloquadratum walsbyi J07HQW2 TaxID=1238425 RepID=U1NC34_9EURY|nr:hemolysin family protein [Haloquadratum walsbyi]ERG94243.1 MAG: hemolysin related proteins containing CBS domain protein [Haloquadratum walsbyi J07HQW2]
MEPLEIGLRIFGGIILILVNAYFVAIEFALTRVRQYPKSEFDTPGLELAWEMTNDLEFYLTTCQVWISATSIALGIIAEPGLAALIEPVFENTTLASVGAGSLLGFLIINLVHLTHGEQTPTYLGVERSKQVAQYGARILYWFAKILAPAIWVGDSVAKGTLGLFGIEMTQAWTETEKEVIETRADLRTRLGSVLEQGELPADRREEIMNALTIGDQSVRDIMISADDIISLSTEDSPESNFRKLEQYPHTRYPLVGRELSDFYGIVYSPALFSHREQLSNGNDALTELAAPTMTLSPDTDVSDAIDQFQTEQQEMGLVIENGETIGLVTVTDLLETIVGDIEDPLDQDNPNVLS